MLAVELMPERQCHQCFTPEFERRRELWGCETPAEIPVTLLGEEHAICPKRVILDNQAEFQYWLSLYRAYRQGFLPDEGALLEQAAMVVEVFGVLDYAYSRVEEHKAAERERKMKKSSSARGQHHGDAKR